MKTRLIVAVLMSSLLASLGGVQAAQAAEDVSVAIASPANGSTGPNDISVTGTASADPAEHRLVLVVNGEDRHGTLRADGTWEMQYQSFDFGWNTLCAQIRDLELRVTFASYCSSYRVLPEDLQLLITSPSDGQAVPAGTVMEGYVNLESTLRVWVDGSGPTRLDGVNGPFTYDGGFFVDGTYTVVIEASDRYGRTATAQTTFTVDATAPDVPTVTAPSSKKTVTTREFTVQGRGTPLTHVAVLDESGAPTGSTDVQVDGTWAYTFTSHELAPYYTGRRTAFTFGVQGFDDVGNQSMTGWHTYTVKIAP